MTGTRKIGICADCKELKPLEAHGRCIACYKWRKKHGNQRPKGMGTGKNSKTVQFKRIHQEWSLENFDDGIIYTDENGNKRMIVYCPKSSRKEDGRVPRSNAAWELYHKQKLPDGWVVHHKNGDTQDDSEENLEAMPKGDHTALHFKESMEEWERAGSKTSKLLRYS